MNRAILALVAVLIAAPAIAAELSPDVLGKVVRSDKPKRSPRDAQLVAPAPPHGAVNAQQQPISGAKK
jgi:hypothetical protein